MNAISHIPMKHDTTNKYNREKTCELQCTSVVYRSTGHMMLRFDNYY